MSAHAWSNHRNLCDFVSLQSGVTIDGGKRYTQTVERSFHISMAALESMPEGNNPSKQVSVMINHDKAEFLLCTLNHKHLLQQPLDLSFTEGEEVTFFLNGQGVVHLTGHLLEDHMDEVHEDFVLGTDEEEESEEMSDEYNEDSDEAPELVNVKNKKSLKKLELTPGLKRKATDKGTPSKKLKLEEMDEDESDEDEDFDEDDDDLDEAEIADFFDDEAEEEESDEKEDEEDIKESKTPQGKNQPAKAGKDEKKEKQNQQADKKQHKETKAIEDAAKGARVQTPPNSVVAGGDANASSKKKKKKKKKNKNQEEGSTQQQQQTAAGQQQTPKPQQQQEQKQQQQKTPKKHVLEGGTLMEELKIGNGPDAKNGKMVHVYYVGRLNNGKEFDSCKAGKPFRFRLGKSEVIKGWESGIKGMKVGGKRRLTVPPQQGYGSQKQGNIPPNSTLIFEVELKAVS